jgi:WD40 repeat protein
MNIAVTYATPFGNNKLLAGLSDGRIIAVDPESHEERGGFRNTSVSFLHADERSETIVSANTHGGIAMLKFDGSIISSFSWKRMIRQFMELSDNTWMGIDSERNGILWREHPKESMMASVMYDESEIDYMDQAALTKDGFLVTRCALDWKVRDAKTMKVTAEFDPIDGMMLHQPIGEIGLSENGLYYYCYWDDFILFDTMTGKEINQFEAKHFPTCSAISNDGWLLALGGEDGWVGIIDDNGDLTVDEKPGVNDISSVTFNETFSFLSWVDSEGGAGLISVDTGKEIISRDRVLSLLLGAGM